MAFGKDTNPKVGKKTQFPKGKSGNPQGRPRKLPELDKLLADVLGEEQKGITAAHQLGRKAYGIEIDPHYCAVIVDRMLKIDPSLTVTKNGEPYKTGG